MNIIISLVAGLFGFFILMYITTNLIGVVVRGFFKDPVLEDLKATGSPFIKKEIKKDNNAGIGVTIIFAVLILVLLGLLYKFMNIYAALAAVMLMIVRIPDLVWEIKHGHRATADDKPSGALYSFTSILVIVAYPVLAYSIYQLLK